MTSPYLEKPRRAERDAGAEIRLARLKLVRLALAAYYRRQAERPS